MPIKELPYYLDKLEALLDGRHVEATRALQRDAFAFKPVHHIPTVISYDVPEQEWPAFGFEEIFSDREKMLLSELRNVYMGARLRDDRLYGIRANYGTGIIASMFGCPVHTFDHALPICTEVPQDQVERILQSGLPHAEAGLMGRTLETVAYYRNVLRPYANLSRYVGSQCFDIQGPFDNASIIWGSSIYLAVLDAPDKVRRLIEIVTATILRAVQHLRQVDGCSPNEHDGAWNFLGGVCVRNDSSVNLSGLHYVELAKPFDQQLIQPRDGWIHFCGRAQQWWPELLDLHGLRGINPYQGEFYDLYDMYAACEKQRVAIVQWTTPVDARCRERIGTGFSRYLQVQDFETACRVRDRLYASGHADAVPDSVCR